MMQDLGLPIIEDKEEIIHDKTRSDRVRDILEEVQKEAIQYFEPKDEPKPIE